MAFADLIEATDRATHDHLGSVAVTYTPDGGVATTETPDGDPLVGIFDKLTVEIDSEDPGVESVQPTLSIRLDDLPTDPEEDDPIIQIKGTDYKVQGRATDGPIGGKITLLLHKVTA